MTPVRQLPGLLRQCGWMHQELRAVNNSLQEEVVTVPKKWWVLRPVVRELYCVHLIATLLATTCLHP